MRRQPAPDLELIRRMFRYDPEQGTLIRVWHPTRNNMNGVISCWPYKSISVLQGRYQMSNLIWYVYYGIWPTEMIDHKDRNPCNMRIINLREATRAQNKQNSVSKGVSFNGARWESRCQANGKYRYLGLFDTEEQASKSYKDFVKTLYGEFYAE